MVVLDTSFLVAFHNVRDVHHAAAAAAMEKLLAGTWGQALLLEYVFLELATVLAARRSHEVALRVCTVLLDAREVEFVPCSEYLIDSFDVFRREGALGLSFTDATIVAVCRGRGTPHILTFDRDFAKLRDITLLPA